MFIICLINIRVKYKPKQNNIVYVTVFTYIWLYGIIYTYQTKGELSMSFILLIIGSVLIVLWGAAHIMPTKKVVTGFGDISRDNRLIITMEWIAEGAALFFIGALVLVLSLLGYENTDAGLLVIRLCSAMLVVMAVLTLLTGARTSVIPIKICPFVKLTGAVMWLIAGFLS